LTEENKRVEDKRKKAWYADRGVAKHSKQESVDIDSTMA
jgi:hypothetical protein